MLKIYNSLTKKIEEFKPINPDKVGLYTCGFTVYDYAHIGHIKKYVGDDILKRVLTANGYSVKHVQNVTDVGHLTSDEDEGDDKLEKGAREKNMDVWQVAKFYTEYFYKTLDAVNVLRPDIVAPATEHIGEQIKLIKKLEEKGFTYQTEEAIYFDTSKFPDYGKLSGQSLDEKRSGAREGVVVDPSKKNPADFAVWFLTVGHFKDHVMRWSSPWGEGFPGWHIECSAMSMEYLGDTIDIHTGGIDHIPVHHENEIAQSEAATGQKFVNYWVHHDFLLVEGQKMSKSLKNFYTVDDIRERGFEPLAVRYLILTAHYRDKLNFTWESLGAAQNALNNLRESIKGWNATSISEQLNGQATVEGPFAPMEFSGEPSRTQIDFINRSKEIFFDALNNDLNTSQALSIMWEVVKETLPLPEQKNQLLKEMDSILGLNLSDYMRKDEISEKALDLSKKREEARESGDFNRADEIRKEIDELGYKTIDTTQGTAIYKK